MNIKDCPKCGGTHYGSASCPYTDDEVLAMQQTAPQPARGKPILCVDFDGVIHAYTSKWTDAETISDGAVPGALKWLCDAIDVFDVQIYSSRSKSPGGVVAMRVWLHKQAQAEWPEGPRADNLVGRIKFAFEKPAAFLTIDDRAICFDGDWSQLVPEHLLNFKPWNKRSPVP